MRSPTTLSARLGLVGGVLLTLALVAIGLTLYVTWHLEGGAAAVNEAGRMRMQTWRLAQAMDGGDAARVQALVREYDESLALLRTGDPARPLFLPRDANAQALFADVQQGWTALRGGWLAPPPPTPAQTMAQADALVQRIDAFVAAIEAHLSRLTTILNAFQFLMIAVTVVGAVTMLSAAYFLVFNPLAQLQQALARMAGGDLAARVEVASSDEFGALSAGFNQMAQTLQGLYQNLEAKVAEKTLGLQVEQARLAAMYEAAAFVARAPTLPVLAQGFVQQFRTVAHADGCALRWSGETNRQYVLLAAAGLPQQMVADEQCLPTASCLCGQPRETARTRVIAIREAGGSDAQRGACRRAGFHSLVSVPVRLHEQVMGEIDLFYRQPTQLADADRALLETLASHLAGAIEALRAAELQRESAVAEERGMLARELHDSIAQSLAFLKIQASLLRGAIRQRDPVQVERTLHELDAGVQESLADVRELLMHFRTRTNAQEIAPALQTTLQKFEHQTGLATHLTLEGDGLPLPADVQVHVLHVVQEALSNVRKHAGAREVWVEVQQTAQAWRVEVRDDGRGFAAGDGAPGDETHVGLRIMRERAARIGAEVEVESVPGAGTCVALALPWPPVQAVAAMARSTDAAADGGEPVAAVATVTAGAAR